MNEKSTSLEKQEIKAPLHYIYDNYEIKDKLTVDGLIAKLESFKKTAVEKGYKNIEIHFNVESRDYGDGREREEPFMSIEGTRLETEEEWHRRIEAMKDRAISNIFNAKEILRKEKDSLDRIAKIDEALSKSSLKCEKCGVPWTASYRKTCNVCAKKEYEQRANL